MFKLTYICDRCGKESVTVLTTSQAEPEREDILTQFTVLEKYLPVSWGRVVVGKNEYRLICDECMKPGVDDTKAQGIAPVVMDHRIIGHEGSIQLASKLNEIIDAVNEINARLQKPSPLVLK